MSDTKSKPDKKFDIKLLGRILRLATPYRGMFMVATVLAIGLAPLSTLRPYLIQKMVDDHIFKYDLQGMTNMLSLMIGLLITESLLSYVFNYSTSWLGSVVVRDLRNKVFSHISALKMRYFDTTPVGQSTTRTISDIETINSVFSEGLMTIIADVLTLIFVLTLMFYTSWKLTLVCMIVLPFLLLSAWWFKEEVRKSFQTVRTAVATMNSFLQERISGMRIVQIFSAEAHDHDRFKAINRKYTGANLKAIFAYAIFFPLVDIFSAAALGLMVWFGTRSVVSNELTMGVLVSFPVYLNMLFRPIRMLADKFNTLQMGMVAAERVFKLLDDKEWLEQSGSTKPKKLKGQIEFKNVVFAYQSGENVLKSISFDVKAGSTLAIVGSTGSGKSSIISLLSRFYEYQSGQIKIDGVEIELYDLKALRRRIAVVLQDVSLFSGTVMDNITLHDHSITPDMVYAAAQLIGAHDYISQLPGGYDYQVMERGSSLSMGQRQLIAFVRALVFDPDILILDEATASIDPETESVIQFAIEKLIDKRTSIIIAHRLSTIKHAQKIMVLDKGIIVEQGSHEELLQLDDGHYRNLHDHQFLVGI
jgi:ATP-binding cassette, subfamily B, multidrug efflux pump